MSAQSNNSGASNASSSTNANPFIDPTLAAYAEQMVEVITQHRAEVDGKMKAELEELNQLPSDHTRNRVLAYLHATWPERGPVLMREHMHAAAQLMFWERVHAQARTDGKDFEQIAAWERYQHWQQVHKKAGEEIVAMRREAEEKVAEAQAQEQAQK